MKQITPSNVVDIAARPARVEKEYKITLEQLDVVLRTYLAVPEMAEARTYTTGFGVVFVTTEDAV